MTTTFNQFRAVTSFGLKVRERSLTLLPRPMAPAPIWLPALAIAIAVALPVLYLLLRAVDAGFEDTWRLLARQRTLETAVRSIGLIVATVAGSLALALPLAWLTVRTDLPNRNVWAVLTALPLVIPSYVMALLVISALGPRGLLQGALESPLGIQRLPSIYGLPGAALVIVTVTYPYALLTLRAALRRMDTASEDVARTLGFGPWNVFTRVTLPRLRPTMAAGGLIVALYALSDFGAVSLLRFETFTWAIYLQYQSSFDRAVAASMSLALIGIAAFLFLGEIRARGRNLAEGASTRAVKRSPPVVLGRWRLPAIVFVATVVFLTLAMPAGVLLTLLLRGLRAGEALSAPWGLAANSVLVSAAAAIAATAAALPIAVLSVRYRSITTSLIARVASLGFALPGIVVAVALVFFAANYLGRVYQTIWILLFAYVILFLPIAVGPLRSSLSQVGPHVEQAARTLGRTPVAVLASVTIPLMRPGILAAIALVFLTVMKELPATLILSPLEFKTLATAAWSASSEAFFARAAAPALMLILLSSLPITLLVIRDRDRAA
jgi:iron(III) transport system permease protein